jgi:hypothetical protein
MASSANRLENVARAAVEITFIMFLFYGNLIMGQYTRTAPHHLPLVKALVNVFTFEDFVVGLVFAIIAHVVFDRLRHRF